MAAARTSQEAVVFANLGNTDTPEVYHLEDEEDEDDGQKVYYVDDMTEAEYLMTIIEPDYVVNNDSN